MPTIIADLCLLLLNLKVSITLSNWDFIWKYKRYARKSQNDATTNQIILKTLTWGEWPSGLRPCKWIGRFLVQTPLSALSGLGAQWRFEAPSDLWVETWVKAVINIGWVTLNNGSMLAMGQPKSIKKMIVFLWIFVLFYSLCLL